MPRTSIFTFLICWLGSTLALAQECRGFVSFQRQRADFFASGLIGDQSSAYGVGVAVGSKAAFGELQVGKIDSDAFGASSSTWGGSAGLQVPMNERRIVHLCPIAEVSFAKGPKDAFGPGINYRETDFAFGVTVGIVASGDAQQVKIIPTGSIAYANASTKVTGPLGSISNSQTFELVSLGIGFVFGQDVSITPSISHALLVNGASTTVGIRVAFALGGTRPAVIASRPTSCAGLTSTDSTVYDTTQVTERPSLRTAPELKYPPLQRDLLIGGRVIMAVVVRPDGTTDQSSVQLVQTVDPAIDREALRWILSVSYWPACRDGRPVNTRVAQPLDFCVVRCPRGKS